MNDPKRAWRVMLKLAPARWVLGGFFLWLLFVMASGAGASVGVPWNFEATGQLGDSFGILSALMASMAAIFTYQTLTDTQAQRTLAEEEAERQRQDAVSARKEAQADRELAELRENQRAKADKRRDSEGTYFRLLELRFRVLADMKVGKAGEQSVGTDAAEMFVSRLMPWYFEQGDSVDYGQRYRDLYKDNANDLGHYFRFTYHIVRFARENFGREAYSYVRLLRAQLSTAEITLIALNCAFGEGREKFKAWVERYSLLHNIAPADRERFRLDEHFRPRAFDPQADAKAAPLGRMPPVS